MKLTCSGLTMCATHKIGRYGRDKRIRNSYIRPRCFNKEWKRKKQTWWFHCFLLVYCNKPNVSKFGVILEGKSYPIF